ncbi:MAG: TlpA family protein disulfide reductase [Novosphingobium sp.]|nr:TlpA family protein disulfide reductase [Novosphingobium sp.]
MTVSAPVSRRVVLGGLAGAALAGVCTPAEAAATLDLAQYRGRAVYVDFWASWCGPCKLSFPFMEQLAARYPASDLAVVTINIDRQRAAADAFLRQVHSTLTVIYDAAGDLAQAAKVAVMPTSLVFDRKGVMRFRHEGFFPGRVREYDDHVAQLVREA